MGPLRKKVEETFCFVEAFRRSVGVPGAVRNFDLAPDGKRIAAIIPVDAPEDQKAQNHVIFLQNFFDEVRRRAPIGK